jgi:ribosome-binding protein aMBF1 (putative translation factor)
MAAAARRVLLEKPPSEADEKRLLRQQEIMRRRIGARIKKLRTAAHLSLRALETKTNITSSYLSELERGIRSPTSDLLVRLSYAFPGVTPASFLEED